MNRLNLIEKVAFIIITFHATTIFYKELGSPIGIPYGRELLAMVTLAFTFVVYLPWRVRNNAMMPIEIHLLALTLFCWIIPGIFAYLYYGQPIYFGMIEERRVLSMLGVFPLIFLALTKSITTDDLIRYLIYSGVACMAVIWFMFVTSDGSRVTPEGKVITKEELEAMGMRTSRIYVGSKFICQSTTFAAVLFRYRKENIWLVYIGAVLFTQFFACQGRTLFGVSLIFVVLITFRSPRMYQILAVGAFVGFLTLLFFWSRLQSQIEGFLAIAMQYQKVATVQNMATDVRSHSLLVVYTTLEDNNYFGVGSLSLMWKNGFHRLYGQTFYISDLGFPATFMRFGIFLGLSYMLYLVWLCSFIWRKLPPKSEVREMVFYGFLFLFTLFPTQAFEFIFDNFAVVFFIGIYGRIEHLRNINVSYRSRQKRTSK